MGVVYLVALCCLRNDWRGRLVPFLSREAVEGGGKAEEYWLKCPFLVSLKWTHWCHGVGAGGGRVV